ncbi:MAG: ribonuclease D [Alphaproteobacteria bacterium]
MTTVLHHGDLPTGIGFDASVAIDTETMGLDHRRDRLCLAQFSAGDGAVHLVQFDNPRDNPQAYAAPNIRALLADPSVDKLFHFARFDMAAFAHAMGVMTQPVFCTKIASRLVRTYTDRHGLRDLCRELLGVDLSKQQQSSDWGARELSAEQHDYAGHDVLYLHQLRTILDERLEREGRRMLAYDCFACLPARVALDLAGWADQDIFAHA